MQELHCAGVLPRLLAATDVPRLLAEVRPERSVWPECVAVTVEYKTLSANLEVDMHWQLRELKRYAAEALACADMPELPELLMLCDAMAFPLSRHVGAHACLNEGAVLTLSDRREYRSDAVDYALF
jgi:hypothetical protein